MIRCDHGIRLDRFCGDCEAGFTFTDPDPETAREWSRLVVLGCVAILAVLYLVGGVSRG